MKVRVKICGLTTPQDAASAAGAGADAVGFVFADSPRRVDVEQVAAMTRVLSPFVVRTGVFVNSKYDAIAFTAETVRLQVIQLHGDEDHRLIASLRRLGYSVMKAVRVRDRCDVDAAIQFDVDALLLDGYSPERAGGTGLTFDWQLARDAMAALHEQGRDVPVVLAGGLTADNVVKAVETVKPYGVDVSSGVELAPGRKCPVKMNEFVGKVRKLNGSAQDDHSA